MKLTRLIPILVLSLPLALLGCSDDDHEHGGGGADEQDGHGEHGHDSGHAMCGLQENCTDTVDFEHGLVVDGEKFSVEIVSGDAPDSTSSREFDARMPGLSSASGRNTELVWSWLISVATSGSRAQRRTELPAPARRLARLVPQEPAPTTATSGALMA